MAKTFDFNKLKAKTMTVILSDEHKTTLVLKTPTKALYDEMKEARNEFNNVSDEDELHTALYEVTAKIMSNNKAGIEITPEKLRELYDEVDYIKAFLTAYTEFVNENTRSKN
jgi:hypothetical protein